jgi:hypothetical protein
MMWYPLGKPESLGVFHLLKGEYGQNKICKQRNHAGDQGVYIYVCVREREKCVLVCALSRAVLKRYVMSKLHF